MGMKPYIWRKIPPDGGDPVSVEVEVKKVDSQGRLILPADWREEELRETKEVLVIKRKGYLQVVPKRRKNLATFFDKAELPVDTISDWSEFERALLEKK